MNDPRQKNELNRYLLQLQFARPCDGINPFNGY